MLEKINFINNIYNCTWTGDFKMSKKKSLKSLRESAEAMLPTHPSDAASEVPDSLDGKMGKRAVKAELDGKSVADASGKHGNAQAVQLPEEKDAEDDKEELKEDAASDLPTHASDAAAQIPDHL